MTPPLHNLFVFRIEHIDNLEYILRHGMFTKAHAHVSSNHVFIGHTRLTADRDSLPVRPLDADEPERFGTLGGYVPFYFGPRSPMLFVIKNGYQGVTKRNQREIVYLCCRYRTIEASGVPFVFTDGHAKKDITAFYSRTENLNKLFWEEIYAYRWNNEEFNLDRERRKQAEMLVPTHVPPEWIEALVVYDEGISTFAEPLIKQNNSKITVRVNPVGAFGCGFYY
jgi:hypothetical protein